MTDDVVEVGNHTECRNIISRARSFGHDINCQVGHKTKQTCIVTIVSDDRVRRYEMSRYSVAYLGLETGYGRSSD